MLKKGFTEIAISGRVIEAGGGVRLKALLKAAAQNNLSGLEFLSGIPGTVGASVYLNSGTSERYIGELIDEITLFDSSNLQKTVVKKENRDFSYRSSQIGRNNIIIDCKFCLKRGVKSDIIKNYRKNLEQKKLHQPLNKKSCGSIFKNPEDSEFTAAQLIDKSGYKGKIIGGAKVSEKHANFIINKRGAKSSDIYGLIEEICSGVQKKFKVKLIRNFLLIR